MSSVSVIVRFRNEATYLEAVLRAVRAQRCAATIELVAVDNQSADGSRQIAEKYADRIFDVAAYRPGLALNLSIAECSGDYIVPLSAHAIPASETWLSELVRPLRDPWVLATYGAQIYPEHSRFLDKRDLDIFSDVTPRAERADSDFWNANSAFRRSSWEELPFDEAVIELEDHHWTKRILDGGRRSVRFVPSAHVYHYSHIDRNDRTFLPEGEFDPEDLINRSITTLSDPGADWPNRMSAGIFLGSLATMAPGAPPWAPCVNRPRGIERAVEALGTVLLTDEDFDVRWRVAGALGRIGTKDAVPFLVRGLRDPSFYARDECAWSLARLGDLGATGLRAAVPELPEPAVPFAALALGLTGADGSVGDALGLLDDCLRSADRSVQLDAVYFLGELDPVRVLRQRPSIHKQILSRIDDPDYRHARAAVWCWGRLAAAHPGVDGLADMIEVSRTAAYDVVRAEAVTAIGRHASPTADPAAWSGLADAVRYDGSGRVRFAALQSTRLQGNAPDEFTDVLLDLPVDEDFGVEFERVASTGPGHGRDRN